MKAINRLTNFVLVICSLTFLGFAVVLIRSFICKNQDFFDLDRIAQLLVVTLVVVVGLIWIRFKFNQTASTEANEGNLNSVNIVGDSNHAYQIPVNKELLKCIVKYCGYTLFLFVFIVSIAIVCKSMITNTILIVSAIIVVIAFSTLMFTLWIIKEMQPEEVKKEREKRQDVSNREIRAQAHEIEMIKQLKKSMEDKTIHKEKFDALNDLMKRFKEELNKL